jgi:hypothetical protein
MHIEGRTPEGPDTWEWEPGGLDGQDGNVDIPPGANSGADEVTGRESP